MWLSYCSNDLTYLAFLIWQLLVKAAYPAHKLGSQKGGDNVLQCEADKGCSMYICA